MTYKITLIPGDGIGPEISRAATCTVDATGVESRFERTVSAESPAGAELR